MDCLLRNQCIYSYVFETPVPDDAQMMRKYTVAPHPFIHCGHRLDDQGFKDLIEQARKVQTVKRALYWHDWERYSNRQKTRMKLGGFMGEITYKGDFEPFLPYIRLGEYVHVGKGSSFGLGRYRIV